MNVTRREFLATAALGALATGAATAQTPPATGPKLKLGVIGCGGRGSWITNLFVENGNYTIHAGADYFPDRIKTFGDKFQVPEERRFTGLDGYKRLLESGVDAVAIESPPYFHPGQAAAAVDAGKHVYLAKPIAVDVPGCRTVEASGKAATGKKQVFLVDFQTRSTPFYMEALKNVHAGDLGTLAFGEAIYHGGCPFGGYFDSLRKNGADPEVRLRAWGLDRVLSGDIITEQFIHTLDVMNWVMQTPPTEASGSCGLRTREAIGTCSDHFTSLIRYGDGTTYTFSGRQIEGHDTKPDGIRVRVFGSQGVLETEYGGQVMIRGAKFYKGGRCPGIYADGAKANIAEFHRRITAGEFDNPTVAPSVQSNLITILCRTAAYAKSSLTWDALLTKGETLALDLKGLKA